MAIQRYQSRFQPSSLLAQFNDEINRMFVQDNNAFPALSGSAWTPNVDIRETGDAYHIEAEVPGVDPQTIEVTLDKGVLTLKGQRSEERADESGQARYRERRFGSFVRRFSLPETADEDSRQGPCRKRRTAPDHQQEGAGRAAAYHGAQR